MIQSNYRIRNLSDCPHHIPVIAKWMWQEWDRLLDWTMAQSVHECESWAQRDAIPWGIIAEHNGIAIGTMCLHPHDLDERPDLSPWMACQYVHPDWRGRGVAIAMSAALKERAKQLGFKRLYMWTNHNPAIYGRYGYDAMGAAQSYGRAVVVLSKIIE